MQVAVIAAASQGGVPKATSAELDEQASEQVIYLMPDQVGKQATGGIMRL